MKACKKPEFAHLLAIPQLKEIGVICIVNIVKNLQITYQITAPAFLNAYFESRPVKSPPFHSLNADVFKTAEISTSPI